MATGQVLFQRFFYTKSFVKHSMEHVSMACVHLASKIEEAPRRIRDVINVFHRLRHLREKKKPVPLLLDQDYVNLKNQIIKAERRVLKELGFCVHVKHPHKIIVMYLQVLECERNQHLVQTSWNYMNDSLRTDVFVRFQPESIACACIYLAARTLEIPLPNRPHWFLLFGATEEEIQEICLKILQLYTRKKVDLTHLESEVEKRRHALDEAKAQAKGLLPSSTQVLDSASRFSPAPKPVESPKEGKGNKPSPLSVKNTKRKVEGVKKTKVDSPVNGLPKGQGSRSRSGSHEQSYSRSPSRSASPKRRYVLLGCMGLQQALGCFLGKCCGLSLGTIAPDPEVVRMGGHLPGGLLHRKSDSGSTSGGSKSQSRSRSRSDSPPRQAHRGAPYKGSKVRSYRRSKDCNYSAQKPHKSRSRSSSRSRSHSRERADTSGKYKKKSHYYREQRRERSRSYERTGHRYERDHPGHSRHRR
ncbi:cyclin-L2 isoform X3 [Ovis aries]|nr:cyclin-L2 isoform X3 [Ovis aries]